MEINFMSDFKFTVQSENLETGRAIWRLDNVRIAYPHLFTPGIYEGKESTRLSADFLIPDKAVATDMAKKMVALAKAVNKSMTKDKLKNFKVVNDEKLGFVLKSTNSIDYPAAYFDGSGQKVSDPIAAGAEKKIYSGCVVRAKVEVNYDDQSKKAWVNLAAIQFMGEGDVIGASMTQEELSEGFDAVEGDFGDEGSSDDEDFDLDGDSDDTSSDDDFEL
jgi:hypothetical protein